jgi:hypothetical protein
MAATTPAGCRMSSELPIRVSIGKSAAMSAMERNTSTDRPTCTRREAAIGVPTSRLIISASCSPRASRPSATARSAAARSGTGVRDHAGNAAWAAATARSTSGAAPRGTLPMTSSVRLSTTSMSPSVSGLTHRPPM